MRIRQQVSKGAVAGGIATLSVVVCGLGVATAANGDSLTLGHHNTATTTTTLTDKHGTPLSLIGKKSKPPLQVNSSKLVKKLNAAMVGGLSSGQLSSGSAAGQGTDIAQIASGTLHALELPHASGSSFATATFVPVSVAQTAPLAAGTYYATGTAFGSSTLGALCYVGTTQDFPNGARQYSAIGEDSILDESSVTDQVAVAAGQRIHEWCVNLETSDSAGPSYLLSYGVTAIRIAASHPGSTATPSLSLDRRTKIRP